MQNNNEYWRICANKSIFYSLFIVVTEEQIQHSFGGTGFDIPSEPTSSDDRRAQRRSKARSGTGATRSFLRLAKCEHGEDRPFGQSEHVDRLRAPARGSVDRAARRMPLRRRRLARNQIAAFMLAESPLSQRQQDAQTKKRAGVGKPSARTSGSIRTSQFIYQCTCWVSLQQESASRPWNADRRNHVTGWSTRSCSSTPSAPASLISIAAEPLRVPRSSWEMYIR